MQRSFSGLTGVRHGTRCGVPLADIICPFCGESFAVTLDESEGRQLLVADCETCCRPMEIEAEIQDGEVARAGARD